MLSDKQIIEAMEQGNIIIEPFDKRHLGTNSYDCRLGEYYFKGDDTMKVARLDDESIREYWGRPKRAISGEIAVEPGTTILAHTIEVIGGINGYLVNMHARSTTVRSGLSVCRCGGAGDTGYVSRWCMEISNHTRSTIVIPVGFRICQFSVEYVGETLKSYYTSSHSGNYGKDWTPFDMLPQMLKQWDRDEIQRIRDDISKDAMKGIDEIAQMSQEFGIYY